MLHLWGPCRSRTTPSQLPDWWGCWCGERCQHSYQLTPSLLWDSLTPLLLWEEHVHLHADNCVGQNKNNAVIQVIYMYMYCTAQTFFICLLTWPHPHMHFIVMVSRIFHISLKSHQHHILYMYMDTILYSRQASTCTVYVGTCFTTQVENVVS